MPRPFAFGLRAWNMLARFMTAIFWPPEGAQPDPLAPKVPAAQGAPELSRVRSER
jgi:hypothetical protein